MYAQDNLESVGASGKDKSLFRDLFQRSEGYFYGLFSDIWYTSQVLVWKLGVP